MSIIEQIKAEIERLKNTDGVCQNNNETADVYYARGAKFTCEALLSFLSNLEKSEKPINQEELDDAIDKWLYGRQIIERKNGKVYFQHIPSFSDYQNDWKNEGNAGGVDLAADGLRDFARHFAKWGTEHAKK